MEDTEWVSKMVCGSESKMKRMKEEWGQEFQESNGEDSMANLWKCQMWSEFQQHL